MRNLFLVLFLIGGCTSSESTIEQDLINCKENLHSCLNNNSCQVPECPPCPPCEQTDCEYCIRFTRQYGRVLYECETTEMRFESERRHACQTVEMLDEICPIFRNELHLEMEDDDGC